MVATVQDGIVLDLRPSITVDRKSVNVAAAVSLAQLERPIREFRTKIAGFDQEVAIQLPEVRVSKLDKHVVVPDGGTVVLGGWARDGGLVVVVLRATIAS